MSPFSFGFDFLDIRILEQSDFFDSLRNLVENSDTIHFGDFHVTLNQKTDKRRIFWIYDKYNIKIASVFFSQKLSYIQFVGAFFMLYPDHLDFFLSLFNIDSKKLHRVRRFDFRWDFYAPISYFKGLKKSHSYYQSGFLHLGVDSGEKIVTSLRADSLTHEVSLYDKKIDILRTQKYLLDIPDSPYQSYMKNPQPISRLEVRFMQRSVGRLEKDSIEYVLLRGQSLAYSYMQRFYNLEFNFDKVNKQTFEDRQFSEISKKKLNLYKNMAYSYCDNVRLLGSEKELFQFLFKSFPQFAKYALTLQYLEDFSEKNVPI